MVRISELLLSFVVNSAWQVVVIFVIAGIGGYLAREHFEGGLKLPSLGAPECVARADGAVRVVASHARLHQREQHRLTEHEPVRRIEVLAHALGIHEHPLDDGPELHEHVVGELQRVGQDDALHGRMRDVALVPQRNVLEPRLQVAAQHASEPAELLGLHRATAGRRELRHGADRVVDGCRDSHAAFSHAAVVGRTRVGGIRVGPTNEVHDESKREV